MAATKGYMQPIKGFRGHLRFIKPIFYCLELKLCELFEKTTLTLVSTILAVCIGYKATKSIVIFSVVLDHKWY